MDKITLTLGVQTYNLIVQALQELPWRMANPVFQEIDPQVRAALEKSKMESNVDGPRIGLVDKP